MFVGSPSKKDALQTLPADIEIDDPLRSMIERTARGDFGSA
jgi:hypothetical protein